MFEVFFEGIESKIGSDRVFELVPEISASFFNIIMCNFRFHFGCSKSVCSPGRVCMEVSVFVKEIVKNSREQFVFVFEHKGAYH